MENSKRSFKTIDEYIASYPKDVQTILKNIRLTVREAAPEAQETIKYRMPTFTLSGNLVFFAAFKKHIGFYPPIRGSEAFNKRLSAYEGPKGSLIFPFDKPIPYDLISEMVSLRVKENLAKAEEKAKKKQEIR